MIVANEEHLNILKKGVVSWNEWRERHYLVEPDLTGADLSEECLSIDSRGSLDPGGEEPKSVNPKLAKLSGANFSKSYLDLADLRHADLSGAQLNSAQLNGANLSGAQLRGASLTNADLTGAVLMNVDFSHALIGWTTFASNDLGATQGLESVEHYGPSTISVDTLSKSGGQIPDTFLRGCGLSDWEIEAAKLYSAGLKNEELTDILYAIHNLRSHHAIQINPLFISYSHKDSPFVNRIEQCLNEKGIRFWRDVHHATAGRLEKQVDRAMRLNPTVLLVLSSNSVESDWVEHEVRLARELEKELKRDVICPVALDGNWKECGWPERLREQVMEYNILDFSEWNDESEFAPMFTRLIEGLDLFYK
jgi:uncharacterized protein YjbI with pentapeptide repeats